MNRYINNAVNKIKNLDVEEKNKDEIINLLISFAKITDFKLRELALIIIKNLRCKCGFTILQSKEEECNCWLDIDKWFKKNDISLYGTEMSLKIKENLK